MMKQAGRLLLSILLIATLGLVDARRLAACSCPAGLPMLDAIAGATAIFSGKVDQVSWTPAPSVSTAGRVAVTVDVLQVWKGPSSERLIVNMADVCSFPFAEDKEYLIFANEQDGELHTSLCSRNQALDLASREIGTLDALFGPGSPARSSAPGAVTVTAHGTYAAFSDRLEVRLLFKEEQETPLSARAQESLEDLLLAKGLTAEMLFLNYAYADATGYSFAVNEAHMPNGDVDAMLDLLVEVEEALQEESDPAIAGIEVRFALQDCTEAAFRARANALGAARMQAELLAALAGGARGEVVGLAEEAPVSVPRATANFCDAVQGRWHAIPLRVDSENLRQLEWQATLTVTYAVEARTVERPAPPTSPLPTPATTFISPLPTPSAP